ncbi:MAG: GntR family transcriptional regulator [Nitrospinota bacterium]
MAISSLQPLRKGLLFENVMSAIRSAIFNGELKLGNRLVETELAEQLGVSRGPIREALRLLAAEGLVVINVHRGTFVVKPTAADVEEIYTLREALEALAIRRGAELATDEEIKSLEDDTKRSLAAHPQKQIGQLVGLNMEFHGQLIELARHKRLSRMWSTLESQLRLCNILSIERTRQDLRNVINEHLEIAKAIRNRDADSACQLMSQHVGRAAQIVLERIEAAGAATA